MDSRELRENFLEFFRKREHTIVPSSSLIPNDPSVLLTTAGMQQFKPYYTGELDPIKDFDSKNTASVQKSFRTSDIDEVGDESHLTFFEMLGNFSFGGYFKREAIRYAYDFIVGELGLELGHVTVFDPAKVAKGDWRAGVPFDEESYKIWRDEIGLPESMIRREGVDNFWGPTGNEGPCGPTTELYVSGIEIWNIVFNEFYRDNKNQLTPLKVPGVDTGMGLERLAMVAQKAPTIFETDLFSKAISLLPVQVTSRVKRIVVDHCRGIVFLLADGVRPSNKEAGYILRRLMRRIIAYERKGINAESVLEEITEKYSRYYPEIKREILGEYLTERDRFLQTLDRGQKELENFDVVTPEIAFKLFSTYGMPFEVIKEIGGEKVNGLTYEDFDKELQKHQEVSRAGQEKKFGGHGLLLDTGELKAADEEELKKVTRLHTATHLLQAALRQVLGENIRQAGSDITPDRLRFDFTFDRKLSEEEIAQTEKIANQAVEENIAVEKEEMTFKEAVQSGALAFFKAKYPERVSVYSIKGFSKEICGGPHVATTGEIGRIRITKQESSSAGVRRIRAVVE